LVKGYDLKACWSLSKVQNMVAIPKWLVDANVEKETKAMSSIQWWMWKHVLQHLQQKTQKLQDAKKEEVIVFIMLNAKSKARGDRKWCHTKILMSFSQLDMVITRKNFPLIPKEKIPYDLKWN